MNTTTEHERSAADVYEVWLAGVRTRMVEVREELGLSFRAAEAATGVPFASIQRAEAGRVAPSLELLWRLAAGYGVPLARFIDPPAVAEPASGASTRPRGKSQ
jgi:transcriptional regulator with XRE-family HTH domain